jgi:hypothetical protein
MNRGYNEIRQHCKLIDYRYELAGKGGLWVETWQEGSTTHRALFGESYTDLPMTIITTYDDPSQRQDHCEDYC